MGFTRPGIQTELDRFFKSLSPSIQFDSVTKGAFTQSRSKLKPETFIELDKANLSYFETRAIKKQNWKGKRIIAIDGSNLNLPHTQDVKNEFGSTKNQYQELINAHCSFAYDVCNELIIDAKIASKSVCEQELVVSHLSSLNPENDILVFDRGYPAQWLMELLNREGFKFCFRLSRGWNAAKTIMKDNQKDIDWSVTRRGSKDSLKVKALNLSTQTNGLRLTSILLPSQQQEVLATNLTDRDEFNIKSLKELYKLRWAIEESYKLLKKGLHIEYFTGKTALAVKQDFHAKVLMLNLGSMIRSQSSIRKGKKAKHKVQLNKTQTLAKLKDFLIDIFYLDNLRENIVQMLRVLEKCHEIVRPNRTFERKVSSSRRRHKVMTYKGI